MEALELQKYLQVHGLSALQTAFGVKARRHAEFDNLVCLKYSQYESPMEQVIVQQCRGIILDEATDWAVVSYPYDKFFNYGEPNATALDWTLATVQDKLDGSLMTLYFYSGQWRVQSSGTPDASGEVSGYRFSFEQLFWQTWERLGYGLPTEYEDYCFMFELETPYNRVVVQHRDHALTLHGVRNVKTFVEELPTVWADKTGWQAVNSYAFGTIEALVAQAEQLDPLQQEGFIVCEVPQHERGTPGFKRIKLKSSEYVELSHLKDGSSYRKLLSVVVNNESAEFLAYFQELQAMFDEIQVKYAALVTMLEGEYEKYKDIEVQKDFAMTVKDFPYSGVLFALRAGKVTSVRDCLAGLPIVRVEQYLEEWL